MYFLHLLLFCVVVNAAPIEEKNDNERNNTSENDLDGESRAGIVDTLNPFNKNEPTATQDKNRADEQNNNPLTPIQNLFNNTSPINFLNFAKPFEQILSFGQGNNFLNDVKMFLVGTQGMVFPASALLGGFQNFVQNIGNMGNFFQGAQNLLPPLPAGGK